ncbi:MAG: UvrD-helicase domain-containing protein [Pseudomonas sp.]
MRLDRALAGSAGERLAERIREQFPIALIDEFQDTDPLQYRIFERVYRIGENPRTLGLLHDRRPQAGDLRVPRRRHPHLPARARRPPRGGTTRWAPTTARHRRMVDAVNRSFLHAERPSARGASASPRGRAGKPRALRVG